ncbi:MAG: hypothetical protein AAB558_00260 [Patescibacteria group bacterium]
MLTLLLSLTAQAAAAELQSPQLRMGFHAQGEQQAHTPLTHLMFPDVVSGAAPYVYAGLKHQFTDQRWNLETLLGSGLTPDGLDPVLSLRLERSAPLLYLWVDAEYAPLAQHNLYGFATVAVPLGPWLVGVDSEDWVNLGAEAEGATNQVQWSVGPTVGIKLGPYLFLAQSLLWTRDGPIPRTYFQLFL